MPAQTRADPAWQVWRKGAARVAPFVVSSAVMSRLPVELGAVRPACSAGHPPTRRSPDVFRQQHQRHPIPCAGSSRPTAQPPRPRPAFPPPAFGGESAGGRIRSAPASFAQPASAFTAIGSCADCGRSRPGGSKGPPLRRHGGCHPRTAGGADRCHLCLRCTAGGDIRPLGTVQSEGTGSLHRTG